MVTVGIDHSKNSPGVCIRTDSEIVFHSFIRARSTDKKMQAHLSYLQELGVSVFQNSRAAVVKDYAALERWKIEDSYLVAEAIVSSLPDEVDMVGVEGFSYGSKGNAGLDIAGYSYSLRRELCKKYGPEKLFIFAPSNVKRAAGKGNAGKIEVMEFFLQREDEILRAHPFWRALFEGEIVKDRAPVQDLVDSFFVQECARAEVEKLLIQA